MLLWSLKRNIRILKRLSGMARMKEICGFCRINGFLWLWKRLFCDVEKRVLRDETAFIRLWNGLFGRCMSGLREFCVVLYLWLSVCYAVFSKLVFLRWRSQFVENNALLRSLRRIFIRLRNVFLHIYASLSYRNSIVYGSLNLYKNLMAWQAWLWYVLRKQLYGITLLLHCFSDVRKNFRNLYAIPLFHYTFG